MYIERNKYLKQLISLLNNKMIKIISGIRRCGKSFLLFEIFYSYLKSNVAKDEGYIIKLAFDILKLNVLEIHWYYQNTLMRKLLMMIFIIYCLMKKY